MVVAGERSGRTWIWFGFGIFSGMLLSLCMIGSLLYFLPQWLVIKNVPTVAEAAIVLGGGGGERLRRAKDLYDQHLVSELILIGEGRGEWDHIIRNFCPECVLTERNNTILVGSKNTSTDAALALENCRGKNYKNILVVTDPYHTRRAGLTFRRVFRGSGIRIAVVSSCDYGNLVSPDGPWWQDRRTLETVWLEFGKILYFLIDR